MSSKIQRLKDRKKELKRRLAGFYSNSFPISAKPMPTAERSLRQELERVNRGIKRLR